MKTNDKIINLCLNIEEKLISWLKKSNDGNFVLFDPIDNYPILAHYSNSHFAAGLLLSNLLTYNEKKFNISMSLLKNLLINWESDTKLYGYHNDFNNFAFCIIYNTLLKYNLADYSLIERIKYIILNSKDSNHNTINWLPMRIYVNYTRYEITNNEKYIKSNKILYNLINKATHEDGLIDDILPKGKSYNLQYNISTVATLHFINEKYNIYALNKNINSLIRLISPDGDINYLGRGTNQIFAWGPWIYLMKSLNLNNELEKSLNFSYEKILVMLENKNILLNREIGESKLYWWDYHYSSVYISHLYFWLQLAIIADTKQIGQETKQNYDYGFSSGIKLYKNKNIFCVIFEGRTEYLAERGPQVSYLWIEKYGTIFKGNFGALGGKFGNKYSSIINIINNYLGLVSLANNKYNIGKVIFSQIKILDKSEYLDISFTSSNNEYKYFNLPIFESIQIDFDKIKLLIDDQEYSFFNIGIIKGPYENLKVYKSHNFKNKNCILRIFK